MSNQGTLGGNQMSKHVRPSLFEKMERGMRATKGSSYKMHFGNWWLFGGVSAWYFTPGGYFGASTKCGALKVFFGTFAFSVVFNAKKNILFFQKEWQLGTMLISGFVIFMQIENILLFYLMQQFLTNGHAKKKVKPPL